LWRTWPFAVGLQKVVQLLSDFPQLTQNLDKSREKRSLQQQTVEKMSEQVWHGDVVENFQQAQLDSTINLSKRHKLVSDCEDVSWSQIVNEI